MAMKTKSGKQYELVSASDPKLSIRFPRGLMPLDSVYIDSHLIGVSDVGEIIALVPEIENKAVEQIEKGAALL